MQICTPTYLSLRPTFLVAMCILAVGTVISPVRAEEPFNPVWQLMNRKEKQQFIAGYLFGMKDAATMTNYLRDFVRDNPQSAEESLERLRALYSGLSEGKPDSVVAGIDAFYKDGKNREAPLSRAITAVER